MLKKLWVSGLVAYIQHIIWEIQQSGSMQITILNTKKFRIFYKFQKKNIRTKFESVLSSMIEFFVVSALKALYF